MAYDDTPSKIPIAPDSPNPLDSRFHGLSLRNMTPLRKNNTKSMTNLRDEALAQARVAAPIAELPASSHETPIRPNMAGRRHGTGKRSSIGSPGELERIVYCEDVSMRTFIATPGSTMTGRGGRISSASNAESSTSSRPTQVKVRQTSASSDENDPAGPSSRPVKTRTPSFVYREAATPAKWGIDDPDLPSPFIRRASTAPVPVLPSAVAIANERDRRPLGAMYGANTAVSQGDVPGIARKTSAAPARGRAGALHRDVLKANAGRVSGDGAGLGGALAGRNRPSGGR